LRLGVLKSLDLIRIGEVGGINLYLRRLGTRFDYAGKYALLLRGIALNGLIPNLESDQRGADIGSARPTNAPWLALEVLESCCIRNPTVRS
jgi:hypothetical protein